MLIPCIDMIIHNINQIMPSQSYMWFNGTGPCELGQYCGGIYKLLCVCVCVCTGRCAGGDCDFSIHKFCIVSA